MAEVTNEPIYEVRKAMRARLGNIDERQREMRGEFRACRGNLQAMQTQMGAIRIDISNLSEASGVRGTRLSRIGRRLDIIDSPVA